MTLLTNQNTLQNNKSKLNSFQKKINFIGNLMKVKNIQMDGFVDKLRYPQK